MTSLFLDRLAKGVFDMTAAQAFDQSICIRCKENVDVRGLEYIDRREYAISAICPTCFDAIFPGEDNCDCVPGGPHTCGGMEP